MPIIRKFQKGHYYHIYSRGVEKRVVFLDENDYQRFYKSIFFFNSNLNKKIEDNKKSFFLEKKIVDILSFELMPTHFHMKVKEIKKGGTSKFMQKLITSYTMYFNKKYERFGSLFGTTFKDSLIEKDAYLEYLDFYIKYNCIKIIRPQYEVYDIFCGKIVLNEEEQKFVDRYPYYFKDIGLT